MLAIDESPSYLEVLNLLTTAGLISMAEVVTHGVRIDRVRSRNTGFLVEASSGNSFFVKFLHARDGPLGVAREAVACQAVATAGIHLRCSVATLLWHSTDSSVLVFSATRDAITMADHYRRGRPCRMLAHSTALALAELHHLATPDYEAQIPHGLLWHNPRLTDLPSRSGPNLDLLRRVQGNDQLIAGLDAAAESWRSREFVHGDIKFDNVLVRRSPRGRSQGVHIVDWEDAGAGDARWDVGSVLGAYIGAWLTSIPEVRVTSLDRLTPLARVRRESLLPSMRTFWESYSRRRRFELEESGEFLLDAVRYAGVRLIQTASEATRSSPVSAVHLFLLQVGANVLARPRDASERLFGLRPVGALL